MNFHITKHKKPKRKRQRVFLEQHCVRFHNMERKATGRAGILDKSIIKPKTEVYYITTKKSSFILSWSSFHLILQVSLSAFAFLFSELVQYNQNRVSSIEDLEKKWYFKDYWTTSQNWHFIHCHRLEESGYGIGLRVIELFSCRERLTKRETRIVNMLQVRLTEHLLSPLFHLIHSTSQMWFGSNCLIRWLTI